jgi:YD repeat-containing protein
MDTVARTESYALACSAIDNAGYANVLTDQRTSFDKKAYGIVPTKGDVTQTETVKDWAGHAPVYLVARKAAYDDNGRVTDSWDIAGRHTTTTARTVTFGLVTRTDVTKALTQTTITETNPAWGVPTATVDANLKRTTLAYDPLGRMSNVWLPGRPLTFVGNYHYDYQVRNDAVSWVGSRVVTPMGGSLTTFHALRRAAAAAANPIQRRRRDPGHTLCPPVVGMAAALVSRVRGWPRSG